MGVWGNKENIKLKLRYYLIPQALVSLFVAFYPVYIKDLYAVTGWYFFNEIAFPQVCVIALFTCTIAYFAYAKKGISLFSYADKKWQGRFGHFILPLFVGCLCMSAVKQHVENSKIRSYSISNINELRNLHDSMEVYTIEYYNIVYDEYFYTEGVEDINIGTSKNPHYVTEAYTYVICPVLINFSTEYDLKKQKVWIGFYVSNIFKDLYDHESQVIKDALYENLTKLHGQEDIIYFTETHNEVYTSLIKEKLENNSIPYEDTIVLEAHYTPYIPYNGYEYAVIALCCFIGGNVFLIFSTSMVAINAEKKKKLLEIKSHQNYC